ncbi:carbon-nitrogen hydrolase family protein [Brackiella oedipodis]|uniref:carbon-nitrogen hydrolase family protein n=1 Tax=Brackiella oedipodis TaxID=124225 RepID=UPI00056EB6AA|nr:carbon-nitrogen hydrolase family protein [Brackiella oedipodis]
MSQTLKVAVGQFAAVNDINQNKQAIETLFNQAAKEGAELLVLPEASMCSFTSELAVLKQIAQQDSPAFVEFIQRLTQQHQMYAVVGILSEHTEAQESRVSNQLWVMNNEGEVICRYSKLHLYDAFNFKESDKVAPGEIHEDGSELGLFALKDFTIGLLDCYDLRFPELSRRLVQAGADVISLSAAWLKGPYKEIHWDILSKARAIENTAYVLASGQTAPNNCGQSQIIDPMGSVLAGAADEPGIAVATLSKQRLQSVRELLPCLANRRYQS